MTRSIPDRNSARRAGALLLACAWMASPGLGGESQPLPFASSPQQFQEVTGLRGASFVLQEPLVDHDPESGLWARAASWKLNVHAGGASFHPMRRDMERHVPLVFGAPRLVAGGRAIALPEAALRQEGRDLVVARGLMTERWKLALDGVEQTFELSASPGSGAIVIDLPFSGEWTYLGREPGGLSFDVPTLGRARYGDVTTRDAAGRQVATESEFLGDRIRLRVPEGFAAAARYPLVIDPVIAFVDAEPGVPVDVFNPHSAYDAASDRWLIAFSTGSAFEPKHDPDALGLVLNGNGGVVATLAFDLSTARSQRPDACNIQHTARFVVAWEHVALGFNSIRVRFIGAPTLAVGPTFTVKSGDQCKRPKLGGLITPDRSAALVVFAEQQVFNPQLACVSVSNLGVISPQVTLASSGYVVDHSVTASDGPGRRWAVAWAVGPTDGNYQVKARCIDSGTITPLGGEVLLSTHSDVIPQTAIAGDGSTFACLWERSLPAFETDVMARKLKFQSGALANDGSAFNFTALGTGIFRRPALARDGGRYVYSGDIENGTRITMGTVLPTAAGAQVLEHTLSNATSLNQYNSDVTTCFSGGGPPGRALATWTVLVGEASHDMDAALYEPVLAPGGIAVAQTGCGILEPTIAAAGQLSVAGGTGTVTLGNVQPMSAPFLWIGPPFSSQFCSTCPFGVAPIQFVPGTSATIANGSSPALVGTQVAYQGVIQNVLWGTFCTMPSGTRFSTTDTLIVTLQ